MKKDQPNLRLQEMPQSDGTMAVTLNAKALICLVCQNDRFRKRNSFINTPGAELLNTAWLGDRVTNFVCTECGYVLGFLV